MGAFLWYRPSCDMIVHPHLHVHMVKRMECMSMVNVDPPLIESECTRRMLAVNGYVLTEDARE